MLDSLQKIVIEKPVDKIISQIRALITSGEVKPGEKLPPERKLALHLGVSRANVRDAIRKLEFYGILKTVPQSGTIVAGIGFVALEGLITDILEIESSDFKSLVETRVILEKQSAFLAAQRRTTEDIAQISLALKAFESKIRKGLPAVEEDLLFHIKIAEASKNNVLKSLMMIITPDIVSSYINLKVCEKTNENVTLVEHKKIFDCIINKNDIEASDAMGLHLNDVSEFSINMK